jgi:hypothetical protein
MSTVALPYQGGQEAWRDALPTLASPVWLKVAVSADSESRICHRARGVAKAFPGQDVAARHCRVANYRDDCRILAEKAVKDAWTAGRGKDVRMAVKDASTAD